MPRQVSGRYDGTGKQDLQIKIVMLHYDESMKSVQTGTHDEAPGVGAPDRSKKEKGNKRIYDNRSIREKMV